MPNESGKSPVLHKKHVARLERERQLSRWILYAFITLLVVVVVVVGYGILDVTYLQLQRPVAKVGNTEIIAREFQARVRLQRQQMIGQYYQLSSIISQYEQFAQATGMDLTQQIQQYQSQAEQLKTELDQPETVGKTVIDQMVNEEMIRQEAAKRGITASKEEIDQMAQEAFQYYANGTPTATLTPTQIVTPTIPAAAFKIVTMTPIASPTSELTATPEFTATAEFTATSTTGVTLAPELTAVSTAGVTTPGTPEVTATLAPSATPTMTALPTETATPTATNGPTPTMTLTSTATPTETPYTFDAYTKDYNKAMDRLRQMGFSDDIYRRMFEVQILQKKLKEAITKDVSHSSEQVWARHILVADEKTAKDIIKQLQNGADFAELAKKDSTDKGSGANGGDLGWFGKGAMIAEFETAAYALKKPGDITTTPVKSQYGYHIIQLIAKQDRPLTADEYQTAVDQAFNDWLEKAKKEYNVQTFDDVWKQHIPTEPNFTTAMTEAAQQRSTSAAEERATKNAATATPKP